MLLNYLMKILFASVNAKKGWDLLDPIFDNKRLNLIIELSYVTDVVSINHTNRPLLISVSMNLTLSIISNAN